MFWHFITDCEKKKMVIKSLFYVHIKIMLQSDSYMLLWDLYLLFCFFLNSYYLGTILIHVCLALWHQIMLNRVEGVVGSSS